MFSIFEQSGHTTYGIKKFVCDSESDIQDLSIDEKIGSSAYVIATGNVYFINSSGEWVKQKSTSGSGGGSGVDQSAEIEELRQQLEDLKTQCDGHVATIEELQQQVYELTYTNITSDMWSVLDGTVEDGVMVLNNLDNATVKNGTLIIGGRQQ